ncbi:hypothetical protein FO519_003460 [Halicephalobus sp. NKZ332]|nr:hypothetical protein FO519_003460 [Halicephalobus sp. NKZ332]
MATILLKSYEKRTNDRILVVAIAFAILYGICISTSVMKDYAPLWQLCIIVGALSLFSTVIFFISYSCNLRRYKNSMKGDMTTYTLSERYQLSENIRSMRILYICILVMSIGNVICISVLLLNLFIGSGAEFITRKIFNILVPTYFITINFTAIVNVPIWKRNLKIKNSRTMSNSTANVSSTNSKLFVEESKATNLDKLLLYGMNTVELILIIAAFLMAFFILKISVYGFFDFKILAFQKMLIDEGPLVFVEWIKLSAGGSLMANLFIMILERTVATILLRSYEKKTGDRWMMVCFFVILFSGIGAAFIVINGMIDMAVVGVYGIFYTLFLVFLFLFSYRINKIQYRDSYRNSFSNYTLSERFQLAENIRSMNILKKSVYIMMIGNILVMVAFGLSFFEIISGYFMRKFVFCVIPIYVIVFSGVSATGAPAWKREASKILINVIGKCEKKKVNSNKFKKLPQLTTLNGRVMAFALEEEANVYFEQLAKSWK